MKTAFKNIHIFSCFDFCHDELATWSGVDGPWRKVSARKYVHLDRPNVAIQVGTINVSCVPHPDLNANAK